MGSGLKSVDLAIGVMLPYAEQGDPSGVPLLLLHGLADSWRSFEIVLSHLPQSIRAFALTQRGHGEATRPTAGYRPCDFAADLVAFLDAVGLEAAVIAGASSGGLVAQRFAIDHSRRTLGLVLIGSPATLRDKPAVLELWHSTVSQLTDPVDVRFVREFQESTLVQPVPQAFFETVILESLKLPARVWRAALQGFLEDDSTRELNKITAPTLILSGGRDAFLQCDQEALAAAIAGSCVVVYEGAGHSFYWEEPERVASDLAAFADDLGLGK